MLIRCQKCQALYSLQDGLQGAAFRVECGRCLNLFEAAPPARKLPVETEARTPVRVAPVAAPRKPEAPGALERQALSTEELAKALKPRRPHDAEAEHDEFIRELARVSRGRRTGLWAAGGVVVLALLALGAWQLKGRLGGLPQAAQAKMAAAREKLLRDDTQSLEQAAALYTDAARLAPGEAAVEAERAFALLLQASTHKDLSDRLEAAARELNDRVAKLQIDKPEGFEKQIADLSEQVAKIAAERDPHVHDATRLLQQGVAAAKAALDEDVEDPAALRSMALFCALTDSPDRGLRYLDQAAAKQPGPDALASYTRAALASAGAASREKQDRALQQLALARQAEPRLLRAEVDTAEIALERQENGPAREALGKVLAENPQHDRARRLLALLPPAP